MTTPLLEADALRTLMGPGGAWAKECGARMKKRRLELKLSQETLARACDTRLQTISRVEGGALVPRDYLRAAIAYSLGLEVNDIWTPPTRPDMFKAAGVD